MSDLISRKAVTDLMWELLKSSEYDGDKIIATIDDIEKLAGLEHAEMNCIKDGKYTGDSCFGCSIKVKDCEIRDKVYRHKWIPVSERLPKEDGNYLVTMKHKEFNQTKITSMDFNGEFLFNDYFEKAWWEVTAWQPLPEPHKEENHD